MFFIVYKGAKGLGLDDTTLPVAFAYAFGLGGACGLIMIPTVLPYMRKNIAAKFNDDGTLKPVRPRVAGLSSPKVYARQPLPPRRHISPFDTPLPSSAAPPPPPNDSHPGGPCGG